MFGELLSADQNFRLAAPNSVSFSNSNSNGGWLAGAGIEWGFAPTMHASAEINPLWVFGAGRDE